MKKIRANTKKQKSCFYHDTLITMNDNTIKPISDINVNDILVKDILVLGVLKLKKTEPFYKIKSYKNDVFVTGSHLIFNKEIGNFESVNHYKDAELSDIEEENYVYCLITSNHLIPVDNLLFHDWEDLN